jgi:phytoene dehydrogenase-like protein
MADSGDDRARTAPTATDVVIVGGGHNGLVAAAYLARYGSRVTVLERLGRVGGAAVSERPFPGVDADLSRYSYLVSLLPYAVVRDLELDIELRSRPVASYTPVLRGGTADGLLVERKPGARTEDSFRRLTGSDREWRAWQEFYARIERAARVLAPSLLEPLTSKGEVMKAVREAAGGTFWDAFMERPLGEIVEETFADDDVRGVVLTDALIGTQSHAHDPTLAQNRCFLYHVIGNGTGEWRVPIGGMGAITASLTRAAEKAGAVIATGATATRIESDGRRAAVLYTTADGEHRIEARYVLVNAAPNVLARLLGRPAPELSEGNQLKINMVLSRLPRLRSGIEPQVAFAGTFHIDESYGALQAAYTKSEAGTLPDPLPAEVYCHTLTDRTILGPESTERGLHTLTLFGLHTPAHLYENPSTREEAVQFALAGLNRHLVDPIEDCLALDAEGRPCLEARTPLDVEDELAMPGGHIFHGGLDWPWAQTEQELGKWGVETDIPNVLLCGSGARRGGAVSGVPGRAAALALLLRRSRSGRRRGCAGRPAPGDVPSERRAGTERGGVEAHDERVGDRGEALGPAGQAEAVGGGGAHPHRRADRVGQRGLGLGAARADLRSHADDLYRYVADAVAGLAYPARGLGEQRDAGRAAPLGLVGAEVRAQIAEPGGGEQRVAGGVRGDVAVRVAGQAGLAGPVEPGDVQRAALFEGVYVDADSDEREIRQRSPLRRSRRPRPRRAWPWRPGRPRRPRPAAGRTGWSP